MAHVQCFKCRIVFECLGDGYQAMDLDIVIAQVQNTKGSVLLEHLSDVYDASLIVRSERCITSAPVQMLRRLVKRKY